MASERSTWLATVIAGPVKPGLTDAAAGACPAACAGRAGGPATAATAATPPASVARRRRTDGRNRGRSWEGKAMVRLLGRSVGACRVPGRVQRHRVTPE